MSPNKADAIITVADGMTSFECHCVRGITPNRERTAQLLGDSLMLVTALTPRIGYDKAAAITKQAKDQGITLKQAALALGYVSEQGYDDWVVAAEMIHPGEKFGSRE